MTVSVRGVRQGSVVWILGWALAGCSPSGSGGSSSSLDASPGLTNPESACVSCHPQHVADWRISSHAYALQDPVFQAMTRVGQEQTKGVLGDFCVQCHTPLGHLSGVTNVFQDTQGVFRQKTSGLDPGAMSGVSCLVCHSISDVTQTANAGFVMHVDNVRHGPIEDPAPTPAHASQYSSIHEDSKFCGSCHEVNNANDVAVEKTNIEWVQSVFPGQKSCQDCHMPTYQGPAAVGHKSRTVHQHAFVGADVSLLPKDEFPGYDSMRAASDTLLKSAVEFAMTPNGATRSIDFSIHNLAGHALPSGATSDRQMWIELVVRGSDGGTAFESGTPDENGDLRVENADRTTQPGTDPALVVYTEDMIFDPQKIDGGSPLAHPVDFLWEPNRVVEHLIRVSETDHRSFALSSLKAGHYSAQARLLFRTFPPYLLRKLETIGGLDPAVKGRVPTVEMATASADFDLQ